MSALPTVSPRSRFARLERDLVMAGIVSDETQLGEREPQEGGDAERPPGIPQKELCREPHPERRDRQGDHHAVVTEPAIEKTGFAYLAGQDTEVLRCR